MNLNNGTNNPPRNRPVVAPKGQCCDRCRHMSRVRTCLEPEAAGVAEHYRIVFVDLLDNPGRTCPAFTSITRITGNDAGIV